MQGTVLRVTVTLRDFTHNQPDDVDVVLVGPGGQALVLMSDVIHAPAFGNKLSIPVTLSFTDCAPTQPGVNGVIETGTYLPVNIGAGDSFPAPGPATYASPAPAGSATLAGTFGGTNPNGTWRLFVVDDSNGSVGSFAGGWSLAIVTEQVHDYDRDGVSDITVVRDVFGQSGPDVNGGYGAKMTWWTLTCQGGVIIKPWGDGPDTIVSGDWDGDGKTDRAVWRPGTQGAFYVERSSDGSLLAANWGQTNDDPTVSGDFDGDDKTDLAVWRPSSGIWYIKKSTNGAMMDVQFGASGDRPITGDYDGDGKTDLGIIRASGPTLTFYLLRSTAGFQSIPWGLAGDISVPGDYDGDGKSDLAVVRQIGSSLIWYVRRSSNGATVAQIWGMSGDVLTPADYDGDSQTDIGVWRPSNGTFYVLQSMDNKMRAQQWGMVGDRLPAAFNVK
jgi:hypothetical protein